MKIDRLLGILTVLLNREITTAPYLAEKFEVSRRTINRDIEDLCQAGIPLVTMQGIGGGISIANGYKMDKTLLTTKEMQAILAGLKSLDSVSGSKQYAQLMDKLYQGKSEDVRENIYDASGHIVIDLASYYKDSLTPKIQILREAIENHHMVEFNYYCYSGNSRRRIEPYLLVFQWSSWYVWGYCTEREDFRLFKLNRLLQLQTLTDIYTGREVPQFESEIRQMYHSTIFARAEFDQSVKWRLIEEYGIESFTEQENGTLLFEFEFADRNNLISWLMGYCDKVRVLGPPEVKEEYVRRLENMKNIYNYDFGKQT